MFSYWIKSKITWVMKGSHELYIVQGISNPAGQDTSNRWSASSFKGIMKLFAGSAAKAAPCTQTISLKEDLLFSTNYYSYLPFFKFYFSWSILVFSSFLPSVMTHGLLFFNSMGKFAHFVLCCKHENNAIFRFTKLFYKTQILHNASKHFLFWKQTPLYVNQMTLSSPLTVDNKNRVW